MSAGTETLPFIDEHSVRVNAAPEDVWRSLARWVGRRPRRIASGYVRVVGGQPSRATGRAPQPGATMPGFAVAAAEPGSRLLLTGRHRFSDYALEFTLTPEAEGRTRLAALTYARFPGLPGRAYRALVIGSRGHALLVNALLRDIARRASGRQST
jgi:uncharacterized protein YndB with AHSA1/START domain